MKQIILYTAPGCVYCRMAKNFLDGNGVPYSELDVSMSDAAFQEMMRLSHQDGVPVINVDGEIFVGFNRSDLAKALELS